MPRLTVDELSRAPEGEPSAVVRARIAQAGGRMEAVTHSLHMASLMHADRSIQHISHQTIGTLCKAAEALSQRADASFQRDFVGG